MILTTGAFGLSLEFIIIILLILIIAIGVCLALTIKQLQNISRKYYALTNGKQVKDFEDMLQYQCAIDGNCDCIVTINTNDFIDFSTIPVLTPQDFLDSIED